MISTRTPRAINLFNQYIGSVVSYLKEGGSTNAKRLGILPKELAARQTQYTNR